MTDLKTTLAGGGTLAVPIISWILKKIGVDVPTEVVVGGMGFFAALMGWLAKDKGKAVPDKEEDKTIKSPAGYTVLPVILALFLAGTLASGCVHYKDSYTAYAQAQAAMAGAAGPIIKQTFDAQGKLVGQEMGNMAIPMAMMMMGKPESELVQVITKIMNFAPWAVVGWVAQAGFNAAGGGNTNSYVSGDGNISGQQQAGTSMGTAPTSTSNTNVTVPVDASGILQ